MENVSPVLPILEKRDEIACAVRGHQVVIVCGETGSGKSTQLPAICLDLGRGVDGLIGHTQPRRIAARSIAARIAQELGTPLGRRVGYKVRFTDATGPETRVKLMTDGILLAESQHDRFLSQYDTIILDEAHERSLNVDFLLGYFKRLLPKRPDLKLIITSATIDAARFRDHFAPAPDRDGACAGAPPVVEVSGRTYPVEVRYRPFEESEEGDEPDWQRGILQAVDELARIDTGDMLVFLPTERDIREVAQALRGRLIPGDYPGRTTEILPLYARLSTGEQNRVFEGRPFRRIVLATNVAESSLTVPGIRFVVDTGTARISRYSARSKVQRLPIEPVSQASADQRAGRCGRVGPGICVRLYSELDYRSRDRYTPPEIQRTNLAAVILRTKALDLGPLEEFPFLDPPRPAAIRDGYATLFELGAIDEGHELTEIGRSLSRLPVDPRIGRMILAASREGCLAPVLVIASALEVQDPRERPADRQQAADECHARLAHPESDFLSFLRLWEIYHDWKRELSRSQLRKTCQRNFLSYNRMREWVDVHQQLVRLVRESGLPQESGLAGSRAPSSRATGPGRSARRRDGRRHADESTAGQQTGGAAGADRRQASALPRSAEAAIHRALLAGLLSNLAHRSETGEYIGAGGQKLVLWPGSVLSRKKPKWIMAAELVETGRRYARTLARINPDWVESLAGHLVKRTYSEPHWDRDAAAVSAWERVTLFGLNVVPRRRVRYGPIDPVLSRELFIRHGLVEGEFETRAPFLAHNRRLVEELEAIQSKSRQRGFLLDDEARYRFYDARLPADVYDGRRFERWRREAEPAQPQLLFMTRSDLAGEGAADVSAAAFPDTITVGRLRVPLEYHLEPGSDADGVTLTVPQEGLNQLDPRHLGWLVPGLLEEKIAAMIKSLPKDLRRRLVPAHETARAVLRGLRFGEGDFAAAVADALGHLVGERIAPDAFASDRLPAHLRMNVRVVDGEGRPLAQGRDLDALRREWGQRATASFGASHDGRWSRDGITAWDFGDLPAQVEVNRGGMALAGFPALVDCGDAVSLRLLDTPDEAARRTRAGLRRLFVLACRRELKAQVDWFPDVERLAMLAMTMPGSGDFRQQLGERIADRAFLEGSPLPRTEAEYRDRLKRGRNRLSVAVQEVAGLVRPLIEAHQESRAALDSAAAPQWKPAIADMRGQLAALTGGDFLMTTPWEWLCQYPRYLRAMAVRLKKLPGDGLARDRRNMALVQRRWEAFRERARAHQERRVFDPYLAQYRWMLEEYRVSLFAQELGTAIPVSEARLDKVWEQVGR